LTRLESRHRVRAGWNVWSNHAGQGMSSPGASSRDRLSLPDWLPRVLVLPTVLSMVAHATLLVLFSITLRSCEKAPVGFSDEPTRQVGIVVKQVGDRSEAQIASDPNDVPPSDMPADSTAASDLLAPSRSTPDAPPADVILPQADAASAIGPGVNLPTSAAIADPRDPVKSTGGGRPAATGTAGGPPGAAFMGTRDEGMKVVFVVDASGSMTSYNAMQVAKSALMSSLQALDERQQFLIIFYDDKPQVVRLKDESKATLAHATEINKTLARQKIAGLQPGSGTDHLPALELAMKMSPDVIFFLTDALDPPLWARDLEKIRQLNGGRIRIHSIEFGQGAETAAANDQGNFLRRLARQNGGTYRYHDVTKFKGP
jgi:VWA domain-containing protein